MPKWKDLKTEAEERVEADITELMMRTIGAGLSVADTAKRGGFSDKHVIQVVTSRMEARRTAAERGSKCIVELAIQAREALSGNVFTAEELTLLLKAKAALRELVRVLDPAEEQA